MYVISNTFSLFLFLAVPLGMKLSLVIDDLLTSKIHLDEAGFLDGLNQRRERELLNEILIARNKGKIPFASNPELEILISTHINSCKDTSCFCNSWKLSQAGDINKLEDLRIDFIENYYERILARNQNIKLTL